MPPAGYASSSLPDEPEPVAADAGGAGNGAPLTLPEMVRRLRAATVASWPAGCMTGRSRSSPQ